MYCCRKLIVHWNTFTFQTSLFSSLRFIIFFILDNIKPHTTTHIITLKYLVHFLSVIQFIQYHLVINSIPSFPFHSDFISISNWTTDITWIHFSVCCAAVNEVDYTQKSVDLLMSPPVCWEHPPAAGEGPGCRFNQCISLWYSDILEGHHSCLVLYHFIVGLATLRWVFVPLRCTRAQFYCIFIAIELCWKMLPTGLDTLYSEVITVLHSDKFTGISESSRASVMRWEHLLSLLDSLDRLTLRHKTTTFHSNLVGILQYHCSLLLLQLEIASNTTDTASIFGQSWKKGKHG